MPIRLLHPDLLANPAALAPIAGEVVALERRPLPGAPPTLTGNRLELLDLTLADGALRRLVLKRSRPSDSWIARRTGDRVGREALLLATPDLAGVWEAFACPYVAYAIGDHEIGLLSEDLADHVLSRDDAPLTVEQEDRLLAAHATLHARFWDRAADLTLAVQPEARFALFHPEHLDDPAPLFEAVRRGWAIALPRLPPRLAALLRTPPAELATQATSGLPWTLLHGDCKLANFAPLPDGPVAALDWEGFAAGPPALELGLYLAVNGRRLARPPEAVLARYLDLLSDSLPTPLDAVARDRLTALTALSGANLLLWQKALVGGADLDWWIAALDRYW